MKTTNHFPYQSFVLTYAPYLIQEFVALEQYRDDDRDAKPEVNEKGEYILNSHFLATHFLWAYHIPLTVQQGDFFESELPDSYKMNTWLDVESYLNNPTDEYKKLFNYLKRTYDTPYLVICAIPPKTNVNLSDDKYEYVILPLYKEEQYLASTQGSLFSIPEHPNEEPIDEDNRRYRHKFKICIKQSEYQEGQSTIAKERGLCEEGEHSEEINCFML